MSRRDVRDGMTAKQQRQALTFDDPMLFARVYLSHHLKSEATHGEITFSEAHFAWCEDAKKWVKPTLEPMESRNAYVAPRETGKSTWHFLILPLWAAAFGYVKFAAAFAHSGVQAETHLQTLKHELETNELLREDFPRLCKQATRRQGITVADNKAMLLTDSGFVFVARGIDSANLGMKVGELRPDLLILDDIEPDEANYSAYQMGKRLGTVRDAIFPLNVNARVVIVGTVTMPGSIIHQLVRAERGGERAKWIDEEQITTHVSDPILTDEDGTERSLWPARWPMSFLNSIRHTRSFLKNYRNDPLGLDGGYWTIDDIRHERIEGITRRLVSVDPGVTTKTSSDPTGIAIIGFSPFTKQVQVEHAEAVRLTGSALREHLNGLIEQWEEDGTPIQIVYVESNQGGDLWLDIFHGLPIPVRTFHSTSKKEVRAAKTLAFYQRGKVTHAKRLVSAEEQLVAFPTAPHDDMVDAIGAGVRRFLDPPVKKKVAGTSVSYL